MSDHIDKYLEKASRNSNGEEGSNFEILKDVLKAVPSPELLHTVLSFLDPRWPCWGELSAQLGESERIYKKFAYILMRK